MYATVIPLTKIPLSKPQAYTYRSAEFRDRLTVGQAVAVPLHNRTVTGIVAATDASPEPNIAYKSIQDILHPVPLLLPRDLSLARYTGNYYYASLGIILKHALPEFPKRTIKKVDRALAAMNLESIKQPPSTPTAPPPLTLAVGTLRQRQQYYISLISDCLRQNRQVLFLVPELALIPQTLRWLNAGLPEETVVLLHGTMSKSDQLIAWRQAQTASTRIFVGTRRAVFTAFGDIGHIIMDEEQDISYKQWEMNPRYDARTVARRKALLYGCSLTLGTAAPSVAAYENLKNKTYCLKALNRDGIAVPAAIVDMRREWRGGNYSLFSQTMQDGLRTALTQGKQAIMFVNRRGAFHFILCRDCGYIPRCPNCDVSLVEYGSKRLACSHCAFKADSPVACPSCRSTRLKGMGSGVERVHEQLQKMFSQANIARIEIGASATLAAVKKKYLDFFEKKIDILVGTGTAVRLTSPHLAFIGAVNIDSVLNFPDWRTDEKSRALVKQMTVREDVGACVIQTYNPQHPVLQSKRNFYEQELRRRRRFGYPPFVTMIKLVCKSDDYNFLQTETDRVAIVLAKALPPECVSDPIEPLNAKIRNFWQKYVIIKLPVTASQNLDFSEKYGIIDNILKNLSNHWSIDVDPLT